MNSGTRHTNNKKPLSTDKKFEEDKGIEKQQVTIATEQMSVEKELRHKKSLELKTRIKSALTFAFIFFFSMFMGKSYTQLFVLLLLG